DPGLMAFQGGSGPAATGRDGVGRKRRGRGSRMIHIRRHAGSISDQEFRQFQALLMEATGISLATTKRALVAARLAKRLLALELDSYGEYLSLIQSGAHPREFQLAIDLLTTNETYFFREPRHFDF